MEIVHRTSMSTLHVNYTFMANYDENIDASHKEEVSKMAVIWAIVALVFRKIACTLDMLTRCHRLHTFKLVKRSPVKYFLKNIFKQNMNKKLAASKAYSIIPAMYSCWNIHVAKFKNL